MIAAALLTQIPKALMSSETTQTNDITADRATVRNALNLRRHSLIGIVGTADSKRALVRAPGGDIQTLHVGDKLHPGTITAIADDGVVIMTAFGPRKITLPEPSKSRAAA